MSKIFCNHMNEFNGLNRRKKMYDDFKLVASFIDHKDLLDELCNYLSYNQLSDFTADLITAYNIDDIIFKNPTEK